MCAWNDQYAGSQRLCFPSSYLLERATMRAYAQRPRNGTKPPAPCGRVDIHQNSPVRP